MRANDTAPTIGIINRFDTTPYLLGDLLRDKGIRVYQLDVSNITINRDGELVHDNQPFPDLDAVIWRLSENSLPALDSLLAILDKKQIPLINPSQALWLCGNKLLTHDTLIAQGLPHIKTTPVFPGNKIGEYEIGKPQHGAGGRNVITNTHIPTNSTEPWVKQLHLGGWDNFLRVLVVNGKVITAYKRQPTIKDKLVNNVAQGGIHIPATNKYPHLEELAVEVANATGCFIAGVDLYIERPSVLEVNSVPGIPRDVLPEVVSEISDYLHS